MLVYVDGVRRQNIKKLYDKGWKIRQEDIGEDVDESERRWHRKICGLEMEKEFTSMGDAMREFEAITGYDLISDSDQCGCPVFTFYCEAQELAVAGWECGKYMFHKWLPTPRQTLEALNTLVSESENLTAG